MITQLKPCQSLSKSERYTLWYKKEELKGFKNEALLISRTLRRRGQSLEVSAQMHYLKSKIVSHNSCPANVLDPEDFCCRGLEQCISFERQKKKWFTIKAVLDAQTIIRASQKKENHDSVFQLAKISSNLTSWARDIAIKEAYSDACAPCALNCHQICEKYFTKSGHSLSQKRSFEEMSCDLTGQN